MVFFLFVFFLQNFALKTKTKQNDCFEVKGKVQKVGKIEIRKVLSSD